jgi:glycosyltransferase involved in cell wall biosynthesis
MTLAVTVVIPAYDSAALIEQAIRSVRLQTRPPAEILVVDDGSTDDTAAVAERAGATVIRQANAGPGAARNAGVRAASSPLVAFLDADDWYTADKLEKSVRSLDELSAVAVCTDAWIVVDGHVVACKNDRYVVPAVLTLERLLQGNPIVCSTMVVRRDAVLAAGGFDEDRALVATEDWDLWLRLAQREPIAYLDEPLTYYRTLKGSLSGNARFQRGVDRILDKVEQVYRDEPHFLRLVRRRRADVRLDLAWDLLAQGRRKEARAVVQEARRYAVSWKGLRMWAISMLPF